MPALHSTAHPNPQTDSDVLCLLAELPSGAWWAQVSDGRAGRSLEMRFSQRALAESWLAMIVEGLLAERALLGERLVAVDSAGTTLPIAATA